ncbi:ATP-dependent helicase [Cellulomonas sp. APG4]|uniref:ATP-dependent DNA helicase n=1 Tax=Cellulomonas sp. APG4 TaxID=1538656 RepID=UPI00137B321F|nr:ATP-dependent DNA helicase [Cellulomonas sp. APG4]NCT89542.1 ATP-dependent helicase [Cellulomonas sp. APG4]
MRFSAVEIAELLGRPRPTAEQVAVIEAPLEPLLVVAGAGSGKTETMSARVVHLIANGLVEPDAVLGLTFTRKAAGELSDRVRQRLRTLRRVLPPDTRAGAGGVAGPARTDALVAPTVATYNSYAAGLVGEHALRLGVEPTSRLLGEAARWQLANDVVEHWAADLGTDLASSTVTEAVLDLAGELAEHLRDVADLRSEAERLAEAVERHEETLGALPAARRTLLRDVARSLRLRSVLADLVAELTERKRAADVIDFADQVALAARLAREVPEVGAGERARFRVVLLDEYQDTSVAQMELLRHLFGAGEREGPGAGHPVTAVGDPHQSIYGWRGASAGGLARFPTQFPRTDGRPAHQAALATSWRNDHRVLDVANLLAAPLRETAAVELPVLGARPDAGEGCVEAEMLETAEAEATRVAEWIARAWTDGRTAGVTAAVLCRKRAQFPLLQAALVARGLPVEVVGLGGLLGTPEVVDLVAALQAAHDPSRGDALMRLLTGPRARLGLADLHALADWSGELAGPRGARGADQVADVVDERSIVDAIDALPAPGWTSRNGRGLSSAGHGRLTELGEVLRALRAHTHLPVVEVVAEAERLLGLDIEVAAVAGTSPGAARANLDAFRSVAAAFDAAEQATLGAFLAWLEAAEREERGLEAPVADVDPEAVQLLTVHAAKGLEWDVVAVPGLVDGGFPSLRTPADGVVVDQGWLTDRGKLPASLRGDRESLPALDLTGARDATELSDRVGAYRRAAGAHQIAEERRLAYVAVTRARRDLLLTGSWWREGTRPRSPSLFLTEVATSDLVRTGDVHVLGWSPDPAVEAEAAGTTPRRPEGPERPDPSWPPAAPLGERQRVVTAAAEAVRAAVPVELDRVAGQGSLPVREPGQEHVGPDVDGSSAREADHEDLLAVTALLLDERERRSGTYGRELPAHVSASGLVRLGQDAEGFARQLRRPVPLEPSAHARRGTAFHTWVEQWYGRAALLDVDLLPGADDDSVEADGDLDELRARFLASPWAHRTPVAVEVDVETPIGGVVVRSRIDAVFPDPERPADPRAVVVVDWKTGRRPVDDETERSRELQLAVYRIAWSRWAGVDLDDVAAAFVYVADDVTVRPRSLPGVAELEELLSP